MSFLIVPITLVPGMLLAGSDGHASGAAGAIIGLFVMIIYAVMILVMMFVLTPLKLRASIVQDFAKSFDFGFVKKFVTTMWMEIALGSLFLMVASVVLVCLGLLAFCIGIYLVMVPIYFAWATCSNSSTRFTSSAGASRYRSVLNCATLRRRRFPRSEFCGTHGKHAAPEGHAFACPQAR